MGSPYSPNPVTLSHYCYNFKGSGTRPRGRAAVQTRSVTHPLGTPRPRPGPAPRTGPGPHPDSLRPRPLPDPRAQPRRREPITVRPHAQSLFGVCPQPKWRHLGSPRSSRSCRSRSGSCRASPEVAEREQRGRRMADIIARLREDGIDPPIHTLSRGQTWTPCKVPA